LKKVASAASALAYRLPVIAQWLDPKDDDRCIAWGRDTYESLRPFMAARRYVNYLSEDDLQQADNLVAVVGTLDHPLLDIDHDECGDRKKAPCQRLQRGGLEERRPHPTDVDGRRRLRSVRFGDDGLGCHEPAIVLGSCP
jgi:hypothetical protein